MDRPELSPEQALEVLAQAAIAYKGTFEEHQTLQQAVKTLHNFLQPAEADEEPKQKKK